MSKYLLVGNFKMNPLKEADCKKIISDYKKYSKGSKVETVFCPPFVFLSGIKRLCGGLVSCGSQDLFWKKEGSYTGEVSPEMLKEYNVEYCILGHSERRTLGETSREVSLKAAFSLQNRIQPIVCVGEKERDHNGKYLKDIENQIRDSLKGIPKTKVSSVIIAYEPIWAIGAKDAMNSHEMHQMSIFIKKILTKIYSRKIAESIKILYGGSINDSNARDMIEEGNVDGLLVGRASLEPKIFANIAKNISNAKRNF